MYPTIYTTPNCIQCKMSKRKFKELGIDVNEVDLTLEENNAMLNKLKGMGYQTAPIIMTEENIWTGYAPNKIEAYEKGELS